MNFYLDIETIPSQNPQVKQQFIDKVKAPGSYKKQESIDQWMAENRETVGEDNWKKTSFDGGLGHVCCIGVAVDNEPVSVYYSESYLNDEKNILSQFFNYISEKYDPSSMTPPRFIGHNITSFDLRFLFQRAVVLGVKPPRAIPFGARNWDKSIFDTMTAWAGYNGTVSLDKLCSVLDLPLKGSETGEDIDGSKVWDFVRDGKISTVAEYCKGDVDRVREIHKRMTFQQTA
ncbi:MULTISPECIES: 3'-5' exonuclease [Xenorhabdus]|uniref:3'-5' exonuclease n=1 Tax=Xenorhabdus TaxID=626 RepID=UPI00064A1E63|nr:MULTISPECIES: 3'-5' exonuclease [Xenorhabdus]KLU17440.1 hypothetical protein AAY47_00100 [Xenorhabdus griffiniae]KOP31856.1 hypothetical protein AFK69_18620 [Xenorhabdus sp. GDc328]